VTGDLSTPTYLFGDLLAVARQSWVEEMSRRLAGRGFEGYRRTDAAAVRLLARRPVAIGTLGAAQGVSRQAARKVVAALERRGYVRTERDDNDSRRLNVVLTTRGAAYARAVTEVIEELNRELGNRVEGAQLAAADAVLRSVIAPGSHWSRVAERIRPPAR
jgi:DNA-binding MarR family transcriptional regulator